MKAKEIARRSCILYNKLLELEIKAPDIVLELCKARNKELDIALKEQAEEFEWFIKKDLGTMKELVEHNGIFTKIVARYLEFKKNNV